MVHQNEFWKLEHLSDAQLLEGLGGMVRNQRRALAELVAHLAEVEERRLHLQAAHGSMFTYCVARLGMSEDEACRRIELARLARKFPALFAELDSGQITLSVALLLKPVLSPSNHRELLAAARGKCMRQARELVAERFPKEDAPSSIRKLPERRAAQASGPAANGLPAPASIASLPPLSLAQTVLASSSSSADLPAVSLQIPSLTAPPVPASVSVPLPSVPLPTSVPVPVVAEPLELSSLTLSSPAVEEQVRPAAPRASAAPRVSRSIIEPLSAQRYKIQFTADAALKEQLELARNLLRHAHPSGDLGPIVSRALKLLIDDLLRSRFGARARRNSPSAAPPRPHTPSPEAEAEAEAEAHPSPSEKAPSTPASERQSPARASATVTSTTPNSRSSHVPRTARRAVLERDGLRCCWMDADGVRCGSQAWLEIDHHLPAGKGGSSDPDNLRLLCRAHNSFAAERAYGRDHIERSKRRRETRRSLRRRA
ncbi:MAG: HNH endonuclease signature motif containing protein [Deltaproteobacteria bacterium]